MFKKRMWLCGSGGTTKAGIHRFIYCLFGFEVGACSVFSCVVSGVTVCALGGRGFLHLPPVRLRRPSVEDMEQSLPPSYLEEGGEILKGSSL